MTSQQYVKYVGCFPKFRNRHKYNMNFAVKLACFNYHREFEYANQSALLKIWNGIGASGRWYNRFIPKQVWGWNVELPSLPHDFAYWIGGTEADRRRADRDFLKNLLIWVRLHTNKQKHPTLLRMREIGCYKYYVAVRLGGKPAFNFKK